MRVSNNEIKDILIKSDLDQFKRLVDEVGVNINLGYGYTLLHMAVWWQKNKDFTEFLINKGARVNAQNKRGSSPLHFAANCNYLEVAKLLIESGAKVNIQDKNGRTPMSFAARAGAIEIVKLLFAQGAEILFHDTEYGNTPLHEAANYNCIDVVKFLIKQGAEVNTRNKKRQTPLGLIKKHGKKSVKVFLQKHGAIN